MIERDEYGAKYKYPDRSCLNCAKYPCFDGIKNCVCDLAKYGCKIFKERCQLS